MNVRARNALAQAKDNFGETAVETALYTCAALGAWQVAKTTKDVAYGIWKHMLRPRRNLRARYSNASGATPWAVVTGGADGLGRAYCLELAKMGFSLCVIDKNEAKLNELKSLVGTGLVTVVYDFDRTGTVEGLKALETELATKLQGLDVAVLVNNVAEFQSQDLVEASWKYVLRATNVNAHAYAAMARYFVPKLLERAVGGVRSAVINVGTCAAEPQNPRYRFSIYGATKAYTHILSSSLREMYADKMDVMTVIPRQVETEMNPAGYMFTIQPPTHAKAVMDQLGYEDVTYGAMTHCLEYQMRYRYTLGLGMFDWWVQRMNASRNAELVKLYAARK